MATFEGNFATPQGRFALVAARFNGFIVDSLVAGAKEALIRHGVQEESIDLILVPGSFELPIAAQKMASSHQYAAVICLGAIIRGDTDHYDHVAGSTVSGIAHASQSTGIPVIFGVLTCDTVEQAINRAGVKAGNKGFEAAMAAIEMANLMAILP